MEMRAGEDIIGVGQELTPLLSPLAFALFDSNIRTHCSACFSSLSSPRNSFPSRCSCVLYCSSQCHDLDSNLHFTSAEHHLHIGSSGNTASIRLALRLLHRFESDDLICAPTSQPTRRIGGLMSNRYRLLNYLVEVENFQLLARIKDESKEMARARRARDGLDDITLDDDQISKELYVMEEAIFCLVLTNAVHAVFGTAVYDLTFSWINHSCSPNSYYIFKAGDFSSYESPKPRIFPAFSGTGSRCCDLEKYLKTTHAGIKEYGPRIVVRNIKSISKDEEITIQYIDILQPKAVRQLELWFKYRFVCSCSRCSACPPTYADHILKEIPVLDCTGSNLMVVTDTKRDEADWQLKMYVDVVTERYLMFNDSELFCQEMEKILLHGYDARTVQRLGYQQKLALNPLHHLSIKAYKNLASAYKVHADDLLKQTDEIPFGALIVKRISAAYSLLFAGATHHLLLSDSSVVTSVSNAWINAGESLLNFAKCHVWDYLRKQGYESSDYKSRNNSELLEELQRQHNLIENVNDNFLGELFLNYMSLKVSILWTFLVHRKTFLESVTSPIDFSWIRNIKPSENINSESCLYGEIVYHEFALYTEDMRMKISIVGSHCLTYGQFLKSLA